MKRRVVWTLMTVVVLSSFLGCGSDSSSNSSSRVSSGLIIFATSETHVANFASDPTLVGSNAIEKADSLCNSSKNKPNNSIYKALLVDGNIRDAVTQTNWVLSPNTSYYRSYGDVIIDTTGGSAIFTAYWKDMVNGVEECSGPSCFAWTGIENVATFSTSSTSNCTGWTGVGSHGTWGYSSSKKAGAFSDGTSGACTGNISAKLYCVEYPKN